MKETECSPVLRALSDETRRRIVQILLHARRANVTHLVTELALPQPNVSKHLRVLREAGIVISEKNGSVIWCSIAPEFLRSLKGGIKTLDLGCCTFRFDDPE